MEDQIVKIVKETYELVDKKTSEVRRDVKDVSEKIDKKFETMNDNIDEVKGDVEKLKIGHKSLEIKYRLLWVGIGALLLTTVSAGITMCTKEVESKIQKTEITKK